jgi:hypothetical protein
MHFFIKKNSFGYELKESTSVLSHKLGMLDNERRDLQVPLLNFRSA